MQKTQTMQTMNNPLHKFTASLHSKKPETQSWFYEAVIGILEDPNLPTFSKTDKISEFFAELDVKANYLKEQQQLLQQLRRQIDTAKQNAKEQVAKAFSSFGVEKLEGVMVSSISMQEAKEASKMSLEIINPDALIHAGYFDVIVDKKAVEDALYSADQRHEVEAYVSTRIETVHKPSTIRINKRKVVISDSTNIEAA